MFYKNTELFKDTELLEKKTLNTIYHSKHIQNVNFQFCVIQPSEQNLE